MSDRDKIIRGLDIAIQKLITEKRIKNDQLVVQEGKKIVKIRAIDL